MPNRIRRLLAVVALAVCCAVPSFAEKQGDSIYNLGLGVGVPVSGLDLTRFGGGGESPGGAGVAILPQYLYQVSPALGIGGELTYYDFPSARVSLPGGPSSSNGDLFGIEAVARYLWSPDGSWSPYLIGGLGVARYAVTVQTGGTTMLDASTTGLTLFPGIGVKADLGQNFQASAEARWQLGTTSRSDFGTSLYNVLGFFVRLGWRVSR